MAGSKKNLQLVNLGLERRIEITTTDDKRDPYARYTEEDIEGLRKSVQTPQMTWLQNEKQVHLDAWSSFHQDVKMKEGEFTDGPQMMNGQSHRAHLHFDMRSKEGLISRQTTARQQNRFLTARKHHLDPSLDPVKFTTGRSKQIGPIPGLSRRLVGKAKEGIRFDRSKGVQVQRRPIRSPTKLTINTLPLNYEVKLADPVSWLSSVKNKTGQPDESTPRPTSEVETTLNTNSSTEPQLVAIKSSIATKSVATTQAPAVTKPVVKMQTYVTVTSTAATTATATLTSVMQPVSTTKPTGASKPVSKLENLLFGSNLPQPQTNCSTPRAQPQPAKDDDLLLTFDNSPKKAGPEPPGGASNPDMMELDDDGDKADSGTAAASILEKKLAWIQELGFINDTLADFSLSDSKKVKKLEDRRKELQAMIHEGSKQKFSKSQLTITRPEKLIELSPTPLQKAVTAQPFVPPPKLTFRDANAPVTSGLQASRWADSDVDMATTHKESPKKAFKPKQTVDDSNDSIDYWQKTLPKLRPLSAQFRTHGEPPASTSPAPQKPTKSIYESRYAC
ncbi:hypothetical protein EYB25_001142 [Talaromyces marneffei]|uniref:Uncharacterized protein n=1 Tax=Talaromyces marneffei PM1 TaxID=1077442 RepID=A0A093Y827_TALMA|nr:uncharacterized protein EYB26_001191 [Talaromyces marneffei]KAE8556441.1 hypothetical protein EYB25_001142 [Talaromyces marneffei]QGA13541.1 hypothetical protein EYB26_001191 [Talaromyces marneffei]